MITDFQIWRDSLSKSNEPFSEKTTLFSILIKTKDSILCFDKFDGSFVKVVENISSDKTKTVADATDSIYLIH